ncbi:hypothetical protein CL654_02675 [bacterium]|nr:hypothetical protein [bacterium]|tara:strand:- start:26474 stop:26833 length:360 start_codon:yes stop_codon:yes gene_type:complete
MPNFEQMPSSNEEESIEKDQEPSEFSPEKAYGYIKRAYSEALMTEDIDAKDLKKLLESAPEDEQKALAEKFHEDFVISKGRTREPISIYLALKGTVFAERFAEIEDKRLKAEGFDGFGL